MRTPKQRQTKPRQSKQRKPNDLSRCLAALDLDRTLIAVIEMGASSWLVAGLVPGVERQPLKKLKTDEHALLALLERWRGEAVRSGYAIRRIVVAYEAGRDGFWLARWLRAQGIEAHVIHAASVAVSREHRRAKTDRLDTELLKRAFLGWLRGERDHCKMVAIPAAREAMEFSGADLASGWRRGASSHGEHGRSSVDASVCAVSRANPAQGAVSDGFRDHLILRTEAASNNVHDYGVNKSRHQRRPYVRLNVARGTSRVMQSQRDFLGPSRTVAPD
ncbi:MAG: hypothetical protein WB822_11765 [Rhodoplanes sp.]